jgi:hypothetical protein
MLDAYAHHLRLDVSADANVSVNVSAIAFSADLKFSCTFGIKIVPFFYISINMGKKKQMQRTKDNARVNMNFL